MELIISFADIILHLDRYLGELISVYGVLAYAILFFIVFMETGFVVTPFLPGDSLLFAAGALSSLGALNIKIVVPLLITAAILGDTVNYWIGNFIGPRVFREKSRFLNKNHLLRTQQFYEKHGGKVIILARFIPIIRTFAPFVAGIGSMKYLRFLVFNVTGGIAWVTFFALGGFFFGNIPVVKQNFSLAIIVIIIISLLPITSDLLSKNKNGENN